MIPKPENADLEIRLNAKGRLSAYWKGERMPVSEIKMEGGRMESAAVALLFTGRVVKLSTENE